MTSHFAAVFNSKVRVLIIVNSISLLVIHATSSGRSSWDFEFEDATQLGKSEVSR